MARIPGVGLAKGLSITLRHMLRKSVTQQYPEVKPVLPPRSRGVIALVEENCTSCMLCARECPDWCIYIDSHKETIPAPEGGRPRQRNVLDRFAIDFALCMYCGICIEVCPFDALFWSPEFEYAEGDIRNLLHEKDKLASWTQTVPPPPAHDPGAEPPKELTAAPRRPAARTGTARPGAAPGTPGPAGAGARRATREGGAGVTGPREADTGAPTAPQEEATSRQDAGPQDARTRRQATAASAAVSGEDTGAKPGAEVEPALGPDSAVSATPGTEAAPSPEAGPSLQGGEDAGQAGAPPAPGRTDDGPSAGGVEERAPRGADQRERARGKAGSAEAPEAAPGEGPAAPPPAGDRRERTRRPMSNVRGIRPPGALPPTPQPAEPSAEAGPSDGTERPEGARPSRGTKPSTGAKPSEVPSEPEGDAPRANEDDAAAPAGEQPNRTPTQDQGRRASEEHPPGTASSTGEPPSNRFSTGAGEPSPEPGPEEQTSSASPRRRRMADPRSVRPPGRLGPDDPEESEEES
ncbi:4Fe-4S binding protein [Nonomuraea sp. NPDC052265]|uniref:4Fe-4S binding protein n=1 Tax=Nonomuraea sp. NPDC052265 TaxID=3364374 RepID=UPI0037CCB305